MIDLQVRKMRVYDSQLLSIYRTPIADTEQGNQLPKQTPCQSAWIPSFLEGVKLGSKFNF